MQIEPPYGAIWKALRQGEVVPFLGAGASLSSRPADAAEWNPKSGTFPPSSTELADFLARQCKFPGTRRDQEDLAKVASYYADVSGRKLLRDELRSVFCGPFNHGGIHEFLASVPVPMLMIVTNYDTLLEAAFDRVNRPYDLVVYPSDRFDSGGTVLWKRYDFPGVEEVEPNQLDINLAVRTVIFKMHGTVESSGPDFDSFVITEEDYIEFLSRMTGANLAVPAQFIQHCRTRHFLFLGYSLRDWNLRVVLRNVTARVSGKNRDTIPSWGIQRKVSRLEQILWDSRHVTIFDMPITEFVSNMVEEAVR
jgi:hypothetical protein